VWNNGGEGFQRLQGMQSSFDFPFFSLASIDLTWIRGEGRHRQQCLSLASEVTATPQRTRAPGIELKVVRRKFYS
jgi:hypothetical protein